jgi:hypothetical protein
VLEPTLVRPYRIGVSDGWGIILFVLPPCLLCALLVATSGLLTLGLIATVIGGAYAAQLAHRRLEASARARATPPKDDAMAKPPLPPPHAAEGAPDAAAAPPRVCADGSLELTEALRTRGLPSDASASFGSETTPFAQRL